MRRKNQPGCTCCGTSCCETECSRTLASLDVSLDWVGGSSIAHSFEINKSPNKICFLPLKIGCFGPFLKTTLNMSGTCVTSGSSFVTDFAVSINLPNASSSTPASVFSVRCGTITKETAVITASGTNNESHNWYWPSEMYIAGTGFGTPLEMQYKTTAFDINLPAGCPTDAVLASTIQSAIRGLAGTHPEFTGATVTVNRTPETCGDPLDVAVFTANSTSYYPPTNTNFPDATTYTYTTHGALFWLSAGSLNSMLFQTVRTQRVGVFPPTGGSFSTPTPYNFDTTVARQINIGTLAFPDCCAKQPIPLLHRGSYLTFGSAFRVGDVVGIGAGTCGYPGNAPWHDWPLFLDSSTNQRFLGRCEQTGHPFTGTAYQKQASNFPTTIVNQPSARQIVPQIVMTPRYSDYATSLSTCKPVCPRPFPEVDGQEVKIKAIQIKLLGKTYTLDSDKVFSISPVSAGSWPPADFSLTAQSSGTSKDYDSQIAWIRRTVTEPLDTCESAIVSGLQEYESHDGELYISTLARSNQEWTESYSGVSLTYTEVNTLELLTAQIRIRKLAGQVAIQFVAAISSRQLRDIFWHGQYTASGAVYYNPNIGTSWRSRLVRSGGFNSGVVGNTITSNWFNVNSLADIFVERSVGTASLIAHSSGPTASITAVPSRIPPFRKDDSNFRGSATSTSGTLSIQLIERT